MQNKKVSEFIADKKLKDLEWRFSGKYKKFTSLILPDKISCSSKFIELKI